MSFGNQIRTRSGRVAQYDLTPSRWGMLWNQLRRGDVLLRIGICMAAAFVMWLGTGAWNPPFPFREGMTPSRDIIARAGFEIVDVEKTREARDNARRRIECVYRHDPQPLVALRSLLKNRVSNIMLADSYQTLDKSIWYEFHPVDPSTDERSKGDQRAKGTEPATGDTTPASGQAPSTEQASVEQAAEVSSSPGKTEQGTTESTSADEPQVATNEQANGTVVAEAPNRETQSETISENEAVAENDEPVATVDTDAVTEPSDDSTSTEAVKPVAQKPEDQIAYEKFVAALKDDTELAQFEAAISRAFADVERFGLMETIQHSLDVSSETSIQVYVATQNRTHYHVPFEAVTSDAVIKLEQRLQKELNSSVLEEHIVPWIKSHLPMTLTFDPAMTDVAADRAMKSVVDVMTRYEAGKDRLAQGGQLITQAEMALLQQEYDAILARRSVPEIMATMAGDCGMYAALYLLGWGYLFHCKRELLLQLRRLISLQLVVTISVIAAHSASQAMWRAEMIPLVLCAMTLVITYRQELALLVASSVCLITVMSLGYGLFEFVVLTATVATSVLLLRRVRSRTKLIYVGLSSAAVAMLTTLGAGIVTGMPLNWPLWISASWYGFFAVVAGVLMTGLLPFIEQWLDVQTDLSLLELGDVAHPLLQELVRRAPGTYNHSINVASLGESAAEAIGANGLLVRVGAYFHDIGKMLKPQYFVENQSGLGNCHEDLLPAMSTLIIIAHVKDGADLARQHHLPRCIVDFILQHHGTTLVEYFYDRASRQQKQDPDASEVDEGSYRYPGPKPQTREAAVLMLADAVESASRALQEPAPSRIENLVDQIAMKKLLDNQFDECGLTLQELREVQDSLVKSLTGMYHSRVKYPNRNTA